MRDVLTLNPPAHAQVHGDVFRAPQRPGLLSVYVGTGVQLIGMALVTMVFAALGFLSPANRGGLMTAMLLLFVFMGVVGGYASARLYKVGLSISRLGKHLGASGTDCDGQQLQCWCKGIGVAAAAISGQDAAEAAGPRRCACVVGGAVAAAAAASHVARPEDPVEALQHILQLNSGLKGLCC